MADVVCAFYSHGPHFLRVLRKLRMAHPRARIVAVVPPAFPEPPIAPLVDAIVHTAGTAYTLRDPRPLVRLLRQLRAQRFTHFVTLFDSTRLRLIARASGAPHRLCHTPDGRIVDLRRNLLLQALHVLVRNAKGRVLLWKIQRIVRREHVGSTAVS